MTCQVTQRLLTGATLAVLAACAGGQAERPAVTNDAPAPYERSDDPAASAAPTTTLRGAADTDPAIIARYAPRPTTQKSVNYDVIDEALDMMVFNAGPSLRRRQRRPEPALGTRFVRGHISPYRLEGNKVFFSQFDDEVVASISEYRRSLEAIGASGRVQSLPRDEQLAYWLNLHNLVVIDEVAKAYPVKEPREMATGPDGAPLHEAKIVDFGDQTLSLRDVREVVYTHWDEPEVMYGFYLGDLGGPSVRDQAYDGEGVRDDLDQQAREFINSLRGVARGGGDLLVSEFYEEGRPHFFPDWPSDLRTHLAKHADDEVAALLAEGREVRYGQYQDRVADMSGGERFSSGRTNGATTSISPEMVRMVTEYRRKLEDLRRDGYFKPKVIIIDVPTDDDE